MEKERLEKRLRQVKKEISYYESCLHEPKYSSNAKQNFQKIIDTLKNEERDLISKLT